LNFSCPVAIFEFSKLADILSGILEKLKTKVSNIVQKAVIKTFPKKKKCKMVV